MEAKSMQEFIDVTVVGMENPMHNWVLIRRSPHPAIVV